MVSAKERQTMCLSFEGHVQGTATKPRCMTTRAATDLFSEWAMKNKDEGMERRHAASVTEMLDMSLAQVNAPFSAVDVGCGNGWVCRALEAIEGCTHAVGVDGSEAMIKKAKSLGDGAFHLALLPQWKPSERFDLVHSMEFPIC